jgi:hypothetical protein
MKALFAATALFVLASSAALGFDATIEALTGRYKAQKLVKAADVGELMRLSERWCYAEEAGECDWSDIYLDVTAEDARFEISNAWSETVDLSFIDRGVFNEQNQICETGNDWTSTIHARTRPDGIAVIGRELEAIRDEVDASRENIVDCFDYLYLSSDANAQTVNLTQRQYTDGVYQADADVAVTIHFDPAAANALRQRW